MNADEAPLSVTALTARIREQLERGFSRVRLSGEVSRFSRAASGHCYFTIKDAHAAIAAVIWRSTASRLRLQPKEGEAFIFHGHISVYEARGSYQLVVTAVEMLGAGQLAAQLERRKQQLAARGWFAAERKQPLPALPQHIAIVTSAQAAALQDVRKVLHSRPGWLRLTLINTPVQGMQAAPQIARALRQAQHTQADVILLVRGGGSIEDLWCFNEECVVQAVVESRIPVISGIGHEIDTTLVDYAADVRAATPSNAAELCCPSRQALRHQLPDMRQWRQGLLQRLNHARRQLQQQGALMAQLRHRQHDRARHDVDRLYRQLQHGGHYCLQQRRGALVALRQRLLQQEPRLKLQRQRQAVHALERHLQAMQYGHLQQSSRQLMLARQALIRLRSDVTSRRRHVLQQLTQRCGRAIQVRLHQGRTYWQALHAKLHGMDPRAVLHRGYALVQDDKGKLVTRLGQLQKGQALSVHFADGLAHTRVVKTTKIQRTTGKKNAQQ